MKVLKHLLAALWNITNFLLGCIFLYYATYSALLLGDIQAYL